MAFSKCELLSFTINGTSDITATPQVLTSPAVTGHSIIAHACWFDPTEAVTGDRLAGGSLTTAPGTSTTSVPVAERRSFPASGSFPITVNGVAATVTAGWGTGAGAFTVSAPISFPSGA